MDEKLKASDPEQRQLLGPEVNIAVWGDKQSHEVYEARRQPGEEYFELSIQTDNTQKFYRRAKIYTADDDSYSYEVMSRSNKKRIIAAGMGVAILSGVAGMLITKHRHHQG